MVTQQAVGALVCALVLALIHLFSGRLRGLGGVPRSAWLSAFGGVSVAYVFVHLLPELAEGQRAIEGEAAGGPGPLLDFLEHHVYLVGLAGLATFYGVEKHALDTRRHRRRHDGEDRTTDGAFWLSIGSFAVYNAIVGYLLLRGELDDPDALISYTVALGVHFVINDFSLREHHKDAYIHGGRWVISAAILIGWLVGVLAELPERGIAFVLAFIGGGVLLNVLKEELPGERQARFLPFVAGAATYAALLQIA